MPHAGWLNAIVYPGLLKKVSERIANEILEDKGRLNIKGIAGTGISGSIIVAISYITELPLIMVRKKESDYHSIYDVEFSEEVLKPNFNYVIVDDLISSGKTVRRIIDKVSRGNLVKVYLYHDNYSEKWLHEVIKGGEDGKNIKERIELSSFDDRIDYKRERGNNNV